MTKQEYEAYLKRHPKVAQVLKYAPKRSKYGNRKTKVDGRTFASKAEAKRYGELKLLQRSGAISDLACQVSYPLIVNTQHIARYVCDFAYTENGTNVVEDVKGVRTPVYALKRKLLKALYGITIREVS